MALHLNCARGPSAADLSHADLDRIVAGKTTNWHCTPKQISFAVQSTGGSSWAIAVTYEDPTGLYPSPNSLALKGFTLLAGSSNQFITVGSSMIPIAGYQFSLNAPTSAGARVTFVAMQSGIDTQQRYRCILCIENLQRIEEWRTSARSAWRFRRHRMRTETYRASGRRRKSRAGPP
jgi:hypothetical protein